MPHKTTAGKTAYMREWRARARASGMCPKCGVRPPRPGKAHCRPCVDRDKALRAKLEERARDEIYARYGGPLCACCGEGEMMFLTLDHVNDDGAAHRREITGKNGGCGYIAMRAALRRAGWPPILQVLCMNCNLGRQRNGGVCPHVRQPQL